MKFERKLSQLCDDWLKVGKLLKYCQMTNEVNLPFLDPQNYNSENSIDGAKQVARALRQYMGLPKGPIHSMVELLENNGVIVFYRFDFPSKIEVNIPRPEHHQSAIEHRHSTISTA